MAPGINDVDVVEGADDPPLDLLQFRVIVNGCHGTFLTHFSPPISAAGRLEGAHRTAMASSRTGKTGRHEQGLLGS